MFISVSGGNPGISSTRALLKLSPVTSPATREFVYVCCHVPNYRPVSEFARLLEGLSCDVRVLRDDSNISAYVCLVRCSRVEWQRAFSRIGHQDRITRYQVTHFSSHSGEEFDPDQLFRGSSPNNENCAVCLDPLQIDNAPVVLRLLCNHGFHASCFQNLQDGICPVCRCPQCPGSAKHCATCGRTDPLRLCLLCGYLGCWIAEGSGGHAVTHLLNTDHGLAYQDVTGELVDFAVNERIHALLDQSKENWRIHDIGDVHLDLNRLLSEQRSLCQKVIKEKAKQLADKYGMLYREINDLELRLKELRQLRQSADKEERSVTEEYDKLQASTAALKGQKRTVSALIKNKPRVEFNITAYKKQLQEAMDRQSELRAEIADIQNHLKLRQAIPREARKGQTFAL